MGGKSSSSTQTTTQTTQHVYNDTANADASGVIGGNVLQGEINYTEEFGDNVGEAFQAIVDLANTALVGAKDVAGDALAKVAVREAQKDNPALSTTQELIPLLLGGGAMVAAVAIFYIWRR